MRPTHKALATLTLTLGLTLVGATTATAAATPDQADQRKALYQSELERNLQRRTQAGDEVAGERGLVAQRQALYQSELERNLATAAAADRAATRPSAPTDPVAPAPGVNVVATLLVGLVGGLVGGAVAMLGWTATRRRRLRAAAGT